MKFSKWKPRHYYVMRNKTTGKLYFGQRMGPMANYLGSGSYWKSHCEAHGGHTKDNIEVLWSDYVKDKETAEAILETMVESEGEYWLFENKTWANRVPEQLDGSPFGQLTPADRRIYGRMGGKSSPGRRDGFSHMTREDHAAAGRKGGLRNAKPVLYDGIVYKSMTECKRHNSLHRTTILNRGGVYL